MLESVDIGERSIEAYRGIAPESMIEELQRLAREVGRVRANHKELG